MSPAAELLADRGETAAGDEFFRSPEFMAAEGVTHTLRLLTRGGELHAPLIVREIPGGGVDATSPYGYPGVVGPDGATVDPAGVDWSATGLVSAFVRHHLDGEPPLAGATARGEVQIADPSLQRKSRMSDRQQIRRNARSGYEVSTVAGPEASADQRRGFFAAYEQTMRRAGAAERYFFGRD